MNDDSFRVMDFEMKGYQCGQILMAMAFEAQGKQNPDLVRAMSGLLGGMGCGKTCGALTEAARYWASTPVGELTIASPMNVCQPCSPSLSNGSRLNTPSATEASSARKLWATTCATK
jgi:hypothetical protein